MNRVHLSSMFEILIYVLREFYAVQFKDYNIFVNVFNKFIRVEFSNESGSSLINL